MLNQIKGNKNTIKVLNSKSRVDLLSAHDAVEAIYKIMQLKILIILSFHPKN